MFEYISGTLAGKSIGYVVVDVHGVGYKIFTSQKSIEVLNDEKAKLYTYLHVREEEQTIYGFATMEERNMFLKLISISGIGPKAGIAILSQLSVSDVISAIIGGDVKAFSSAPGVGAKTAQRIILELKETIQKSFDVEGALITPKGSPQATGSFKEEAINALVALGYAQKQAAKAVSGVSNIATSVEELIVMALKNIE